MFVPPIVDFLFPVTHPHCNFRATYILTSSKLQAANLLQVAVGEAQVTLMNTSPTQSVINV